MIYLTIIRWIDGDTLIADIDVFNSFTIRGKTCRIAGIDAPEVVGYTAFSGLKSKEFCEQKWPAGTVLKVNYLDAKKDRYGRYIVDLSDGDDNVADIIIANKMAVRKNL